MIVEKYLFNLVYNTTDKVIFNPSQWNYGISNWGALFYGDWGREGDKEEEIVFWVLPF